MLGVGVWGVFRGGRTTEGTEITEGLWCVGLSTFRLFAHEKAPKYTKILHIWCAGLRKRIYFDSPEERSR